MLTVETRYAVHPEHAKTLDTDGLRDHSSCKASSLR